MNPVSATALSGLNASTLRLRAAASNIANARNSGAVSAVGAASNAYVPVEVQQTAQAQGGVAAVLAPSSRAALLTYDPAAPYANAQGYVTTPDVDLVSETVELATTSYALAANIAVLRTADDMARAMLEVRT